ncbi:hypothetical protein MBLNU459_g5114t1 [Dothideomycetes sp. NU459]
MDNSPSSPFRSGTSTEDQLAYYKAQYEQLEVELQEFQVSSREFEAELEKDVEASEKRERKLKEQVESLGFEVEEWKSKYKQSKAEANSAQTLLQKEITTMRDSNRSLTLKLRDIEVANDDYERQARNTSSSLEDLESKYNVSIERGVMLEEEIRASEQDREQLRIDTQRLRDELSDLRIETDITMEKLRLAESTIEGFHTRKAFPTVAEPTRPRSPNSDASRTTTSSPTISTPPPSKSEASNTSGVPTPPSPPLSDASIRPPFSNKAPLPVKRRSLIPDASKTLPPDLNRVRGPRHSRGPSFASSTAASSSRMAPPARPVMPEGSTLPRSSSLYQIKGLIGRMQKIEERVHSVRSKLPPPSNTTPRASPRLSTTSGTNVPATVTMRSTRKRISTSTSSSAQHDDEGISGRSTDSHVKRLSFGLPQPVPVDRSAASSSRPSSQASNVSHNAANTYARPPSRTSIGGARTPLGHYSSQSISRPRSSLGGNYAPMQKRGHGHSMSVSETHEAEDNLATPSARRTTLDKTSIPTPTAAKRQSGGFSQSVNGSRRPSLASSHSYQDGSMPPPRKLSGVGETF